MQQMAYQDSFQGNYPALLSAYNEVVEERDSLRVEVRTLKKRNFVLCTVERENTILLEEVENYRQSYLHIDEQYKEVKKRETTRKGFFAIPYKELGPYSKIVLDLLPAEFERRRDHQDGNGFTHVYMQDIALQAGCGLNTATRAIDEMERCKLVSRYHKKREDGSNKQDVYIKILSVKPEEVKNPEPREIGGDRRCPNCKNPLTKKVTVTFTCEPCGIEYDKDMNVIEQSPALTLVRQEPEPTPEPETVKIPRCMHMHCAIGAHNVELRPWGFYCKSHKGYINEKGLPR